MTRMITKAVFPVAGLGTRFLPATKASPKEMLPVVDKPLIQYAVEEAYEAGIRDMIFVTGRSKRAIEDHFDTAYELENELENAGKQAMLELVRSISPADMNCLFVRQPRSLGLGHAVLCAEPLVGTEPFAVLLADDLMVGEPGGPGATARLTSACPKQGRSVLAGQEGPLGGEVVTGGILGESRKQTKGVGGGIQLTDAIERLMGHEAVYAFQYQGKRYDCGSKEGFLQATVELALQHEDVGASFREYLQGLSI